MIQENKPNKILTKLFELTVTKENRENLTGDYEEMFHRIVDDKSRLVANLWFLFQILKLALLSFVDSILWSSTLFKNYLKTSTRILLKQKQFSIINVTGLAIGLASCILLMLWVTDEYTYDGFHQNRNSIYRVVTEHIGNDTYSRNTPYPMAEVIKQDVPEIEEFVRVRQQKQLLKHDDKIFNNWKSIATDKSIFKVFTFPFLKGNPETALDDMKSIVLTSEKATILFGVENPLNKMVEVDGELLQVTGVMEKIPNNSTLDFDYIRPLESVKGITKNQAFIWNWWAFESYVKLHDGADKNKVDEKISDVLVVNRTGVENTLNTFLEPFNELHLYNLEGGGQIRYVVMFSIVALLILIIACINFVNLSTARSSERTKEIGIRKVVGSTRFEIGKQFLTESMVITVAAFIIAIVVAQLSIPWFNELVFKQLSIPYTNLDFILSIVLIILITGTLAGLYPALVLSNFNPVNILKGNLTINFGKKNRAGRNRSNFRKTLVIIQFALSVGIIILTLMIQKQIDFMQDSDQGYNTDNLLFFHLPGKLANQTGAIQNQLRESLLITGVSSSGYDNAGGKIEWEGMTASKERLDFLGGQIRYMMIDSNYLSMMDVGIVSGRAFSNNFPSDYNNSWMINEELVKQLDLKDPIGKSLNIIGAKGTIVGVYNNMHFGFKELAEPQALYLSPKVSWDNFNYLFVRIAPENTSEAIIFIESVWKSLGTDIPFEYKFLDDMINEQYTPEIQMTKIFNAFTIFAIFISGIGLFGLSAFVISQKVKEVGIRKVLGANVYNIINTLSKEFLIWVIIANIIAWPLSYYVTVKWLENYPYKVNFDLWVLLFSALASILIALFSMSYQLRRIMKVNPVECIKYE